MYMDDIQLAEEKSLLNKKHILSPCITTRVLAIMMMNAFYFRSSFFYSSSSATEQITMEYFL